MSKTENEARKCWCPFAMTASTLSWSIPLGNNFSQEYRVPVANNRGTTMDGPLDKCRCIASECMAWQVHQRMWVNDKGKEIPAGNNYPGDGWELKTKGYCGLAGKPE